MPKMSTPFFTFFIFFLSTFGVTFAGRRGPREIYQAISFLSIGTEKALSKKDCGFVSHFTSSSHLFICLEVVTLNFCSVLKYLTPTRAATGVS